MEPTIEYHNNRGFIFSDYNNGLKLRPLRFFGTFGEARQYIISDYIQWNGQSTNTRSRTVYWYCHRLYEISDSRGPKLIPNQIRDHILP